MRLLLCIIITHAGGSPKIGGSGLRKAGKETAGGDGRRLETVFFLFPARKSEAGAARKGPENGKAESEEAAMARKRLRDYGLGAGVLPTGKENAITDVEGVWVGHCTLWQGEEVRTGVTAILPHPGNLFREKV